MGNPFESIVGAAHVLLHEQESIDGVPLVATVSPADADEVAACLDLASRDGVALLPSGGGSKLAWGNVGCVDRWVRLSLSRLDRIVCLDADEGIVCAQAGARVSELRAQLADARRQVALPSLYPGATLGGSIAADPPGRRRSLDRDLRQDLLGLEVALASGARARCGGRVVKNVTGFDLPRLYCGSLGTLGVVTEATVRLRPLPECERFVRARAAREADLGALLSHAFTGAPPYDGAAWVRDAAGWTLVGALEGAHDDVEARVQAHAEMPVEFEEVTREAWTAQGSDLSSWLSRPAASDRVRVRLGARAADLPAIVALLEGWAGVDSRCALFPLSGLVFGEGPVAGLESLLASATARDWLWTLESIAPEPKRELEAFGPPPPALALCRELKRRFDPAGILAAGRYWGRI